MKKYYLLQLLLVIIGVRSYSQTVNPCKVDTLAPTIERHLQLVKLNNLFDSATNIKGISRYYARLSDLLFGPSSNPRRPAPEALRTFFNINKPYDSLSITNLITLRFTNIDQRREQLYSEIPIKNPCDQPQKTVWEIRTQLNTDWNFASLDYVMFPNEKTFLKTFSYSADEMRIHSTSLPEFMLQKTAEVLNKPVEDIRLKIQIGNSRDSCIIQKVGNRVGVYDFSFRLVGSPDERPDFTRYSGGQISDADILKMTGTALPTQFTIRTKSFPSERTTVDNEVITKLADYFSGISNYIKGVSSIGVQPYGLIVYKTKGLVTKNAKNVEILEVMMVVRASPKPQKGDDWTVWDIELIANVWGNFCYYSGNLEELNVETIWNNKSIELKYPKEVSSLVSTLNNHIKKYIIDKYDNK